MRIGQLASTTGVSVRVIRHYESRGLIESVRNANGYREYAESTIEALRHIRLLLDCGFGTRQIYGLLPCFGEGESFNQTNCAAGMEQYLAKRKELDSLIELLKQRRNRLSEQIDAFGITSNSQTEQRTE